MRGTVEQFTPLIAVRIEALQVTRMGTGLVISVGRQLYAGVPFFETIFLDGLACGHLFC
jgi:hypothetical protein